MVTPPKGDYASVPLNADGTKAADAWDPAKDIAAGEQCRAFGAAGIMRLRCACTSRGDDSTLKVDIDNGNQVRLFHFFGSRFRRRHRLAGRVPRRLGAGSAGPGPRAGRGRTRQRGRCPHGTQRVLKVVTTRMKPGLSPPERRAYSANAVLTEFFDRTSEPNGDSWLILTSIVDDPAYLNLPFMLTTHFKREPDG